MAEIPGPSENLGKSPGGDRRHSRLLADFLFGDEPEGAGSALERLRVDNNRRSLGMTEQERGTAEVLDWAKDNGPAIAKEGAMILGPAVLTAAVWETVPQSHRAVETAVASGLGVGTLMTLGGEVVRRIAEFYPRLSKIAEGAAVVRSVGLVFTQISVSAGIGMVGAALADRLWGAFNLSAAAQMGQPEVTSGGGATRGLPPDERVLRGIGGLPPDMRDSEVLQPPPAEPPKLTPEQTDFLNRVGHTELTESQERLAAEAAADQAAEAARQAALQQGQTVAELAAQMPKQTVSEAIYQMIGDVPHRGEVTNVLFRAIGEKVNNLNEGAIKAAAEALRPVFDNIDRVVASSGVSYAKGGRAAVEAMSGFNSPEAQAIRAGNMGDLEAAGNLLNNVIGPVIR